MKALKKIILVIILITNIPNSFCQLYIKNAFMYIADNYVFVKGNVNLDSGSNIYLRNESQLLQGTTSTSTNTGIGTLSVFQEGAASSYGKGNWCSPISTATALTVGNETFGIPLLNRPTTLTASTPATFTHDYTYNGTSNPLNIEPWFIWKYVNSNTYAPNAGGWQQITTNLTINTGEGFSMKGTAGIDNLKADGVVMNNYDGMHQRYDFRGKPNDGDIIIPIGNDKTTLTGNPYPSAIDLSLFLTNELNCTGVAYFWDSNEAVQSHQQVVSQGGYGTYSPVSRGGTGVYVPAPYFKYTLGGAQNGTSTGTGLACQRYFCPIGQGFMIIGKPAPSPITVTMKNAYRVFKKEGFANQSEFHKLASNSYPPNNNFIAETPSVAGFDYTTVSLLETPQIQFKSETNTDWVSNMTLAFDPSATDGVDHAMDAISFSSGNAVDVYFLLDNNKFSIDVINFDVNKRIPIGIKNNTQADFKIKIQNVINFYDADHVYIHDKDNDVYHEITTTDSYDFTMPPGDNKTRFEITFLNAPVLSTENIILSDFDVMQNNFTKNLTINNPKSISLKELSIYDLSGKLIFNKFKLGNEENYQFSTSSFSDAIYAVKITTEEGQIEGKKILVYNKEK
ncbi:MAG: T9SS type A sorting domain-containing protein [Flavobacterium sp.]|nr:T9SS type A sorting domain-containing protein [Flavobacterium sp.]